MPASFRRGCCFLTALVLLAAVPAAAQDRDFAPVTDAMLQDPDPADWLNWRRTLDGWGYSPLDEIDRDNVHRLQLAWAWPMAPGVNQATPLVHDGVMYLPSPGNVVQAVDAVTGDRIWQYDRDLSAMVDTVLSPRSRSIAIYGDKVYLNTADATSLHSTPARARWRGTTRWPTTRSATATRAVPSWPTGRSSPA